MSARSCDAGESWTCEQIVLNGLKRWPGTMECSAQRLRARKTENGLRLTEIWNEYFDIGQ